jgi:uncharacterized repeat protein (TIGR03803 family)
MKALRTAARLTLFTALIIATAVDLSASSRFGVDVVHPFGGGADGASPSAALIQATDGNFYGTTSSGGASNLGTIFKMTASGAVTILHEFSGAADGSTPLAPLIQAIDGNLYGTASAGGASGMGTVFTVTPAGSFAPLHAFAGGTDGANPRAALLQTADGNLYGTTQYGGTANRGTLFAMSIAGAVLGSYTFTGGFDGAYPYGPLIQGSDGSLYGTNYGGTVSTFGRVFKLVSGLITVVHEFAGGAADGANPGAGLVQGNDGNFYGTTIFGGASGSGTAFKMTPDGTLTVLNSFTGGFDGANPGAALVQATDGNFYGTTKVGASGYGTVFKVTPAGTLTVVHTFTGGEDGAVSSAALIQAASGRLYGTTSFGGSSGLGLVFRLPATAPGDFDGDGKADLVVYRPSSGTWFILNSSTSYTTSSVYQWGISTDVPVPGDYDGDGKTDVAVYRPSNATWYILNSSTNGTTWNSYQWGAASGDIPVPGDYDGDGKSDLAVYRPSTATWFILLSSTNYTASNFYQWGAANGDVPVAGDYDGDGKTDLAVYRPSTATWFILNSSTNNTTWNSYQWGAASGDVPVPADYDGDGKTDLAVYRPSTATWFILNSSTNNTTSNVHQWGAAGGDVPVPGDYDGDGKTDVAVYRPSNATWFILNSSTNFTTWNSHQWGAAGGDVPVPGGP